MNVPLYNIRFWGKLRIEKRTVSIFIMMLLRKGRLFPGCCFALTLLYAASRLRESEELKTYGHGWCVHSHSAVMRGVILLWLLFHVNAPLRSVKAKRIQGDENIRERVVRPFA